MSLSERSWSKRQPVTGDRLRSYAVRSALHAREATGWQPYLQTPEFLFCQFCKYCQVGKGWKSCRTGTRCPHGGPGSAARGFLSAAHWLVRSVRRHGEHVRSGLLVGNRRGDCWRA